MIYSYSSHELFPIEIIHGVEYTPQKEVLYELRAAHPVIEKWGDSQTFFTENDGVIGIKESKLIFLSLIEKCIYSCQLDLQQCVKYPKIPCLQNCYYDEEYYETIIGLSPYGGIAIWYRSTLKQVLLAWLNAKKEVINIANSNTKALILRCSKCLETFDKTNTYLQLYGLPPRDLFDNYMKQFTYRYIVRYEKWDEGEEKWLQYEEDEIQPEFEYIEEMLYDGTHDKLHDGGLMKYHEAGKPKKLALKWHIKKSDYSAYFWFEEEEICAIFNKFYGQHPDTKTDFIIHLDPIKKKYELSLYRYGLKQPVIIPESAYQLIVFKSGFENYRSDNYNQPTGAWIW